VQLVLEASSAHDACFGRDLSRRLGFADASALTEPGMLSVVPADPSGVSQVDFLSIDVEGGEMEVLRTIDFERFQFKLITIENNVGTSALRDFMRQKGYTIYLDLGVDLMFVPA